MSPALKPDHGTWFPIETAPKDGTVILGYSRLANDVACVRFDFHEGEWQTYPGLGHGLIPNELTHWQLRPEPPQP